MVTTYPNRQIEIGPVFKSDLPKPELYEELFEHLDHINHYAAMDFARSDFLSPSDPELLDEEIDALIEAIRNQCPDFVSFGTDGFEGEYGHAVDWDSIESAEYAGEVVRLDAGTSWHYDDDAEMLAVFDLDNPYIVRGTQFVLEVNDHGNAKLYRTRDNDIVWSVV